MTAQCSLVWPHRSLRLARRPGIVKNQGDQVMPIKGTTMSEVLPVGDGHRSAAAPHRARTACDTAHVCRHREERRPAEGPAGTAMATRDRRSNANRAKHQATMVSTASRVTVRVPIPLGACRSPGSHPTTPFGRVSGRRRVSHHAMVPHVRVWPQ